MVFYQLLTILFCFVFLPYSSWKYWLGFSHLHYVQFIIQPSKCHTWFWTFYLWSAPSGSCVMEAAVAVSPASMRQIACLSALPISHRSCGRSCHSRHGCHDHSTCGKGLALQYDTEPCNPLEDLLWAGCVIFNSRKTAYVDPGHSVGPFQCPCSGLNLTPW